MNPIDIVIIGAGPSGLACAIEAKKHGLSSLTIDQGSVADAIRRFPINMTFFSTPELLEIGGVPFLSSGFRPTRVECVCYYQMVAKHLDLPLKQQTLVTGLRKVTEGFEVSTKDSSFLARNVVLATGYFDTPNRFDVPGCDLPKVQRYYTEPYSYVGRDVAVVGGKNSAVETALDLFRAGARVTLIHRGGKLSDGVKYWILPDIENRVKAGEVRGLFETTVRNIKPGSIVVEGQHNEEILNEAVFVMIGYQPDAKLLKQLGVNIDDSSLAPIHDSSSMQTNVAGVYVAGSLAAGKYNNKVFIENGRMHGKSIVESVLRSR
ncbi:MAG: YpdA family putative bacillithiol disulfide reductase [Ignavibacteriales bacterium]|nr:YpdA family putative bacillithiol disulfide reductase [Ignavibacteriales bacterium]